MIALSSALLLTAGCQVVSGLEALNVPAKDGGEECVVGPECTSGFCADGVCCDEACDGACMTCRATEARGRCTSYPKDSDPDGDCGQFGRCSGGPDCHYEGVHQWSHSFGGDDDQHATDVAYTPANGNLTLIGNFSGSIDFQPALNATTSTANIPHDIFIAALDSAGLPQQSRGMGDDKVDRATAVVTDSDGTVVVAGTFVGTLDVGGVLLQAAALREAVFIATFEPDLNRLRARAFSPQHPNFDQTTRVGHPALAITNDDSVLLAGHFRGAIDFGRGLMTNIGDQDYYLARFDASGGLLWNNGWGSALTDDDERPRVPRVAADADGNAYLSGTYRYRMTIGTQAMPEDSANAEQSFVTKIDGDDGQPLWARALGGEGQQIISGVATGTDGTVVLVGLFTRELSFDGHLWTASAANHVDFFITKLDADGAHLMTRTFPGSPAIASDGGFLSAPRDVEIDHNDNVVLFGQVHGSVAFGSSPLVSRGQVDVFVAKFNPNLEHLWSKRYGDEGDEAAFAGTVDAEGNVIATGLFDGEIDFGGPTPLQSVDATDAFLVKFLP